MTKRHSLDLVVVIALFLVYATCALLLCIIGAEVYRETAATMSQNYDQRTSVLYVAERIRQNDVEGAVRTDSVEGSDALVLVEQRSGRGFETWIFVKGGMLYEGLFEPGDEIDPELCQAIMPLSRLTLSTEVEQVEQAAGSQDSSSVAAASSTRIEATFQTLDGHSSSAVFWLRSQGGVS
jgi:hypothetical protein